MANQEPSRPFRRLRRIIEESLQAERITRDQAELLDTVYSSTDDRITLQALRYRERLNQATDYFKPTKWQDGFEMSAFTYGKHLAIEEREMFATVLTEALYIVKLDLGIEFGGEVKYFE